MINLTTKGNGQHLELLHLFDVTDILAGAYVRSFVVLAPPKSNLFVATFKDRGKDQAQKTAKSKDRSHRSVRFLKCPAL